MKKKVAIASAIGHLLEWYDFQLILYLYPIIRKKFLPEFDDQSTGNLIAICMGSVAYIARPFGGAIFGWIGDSIGRVRALFISISLMAFSSLLIGILPSYSSYGIFVTIAFIIARTAQGVSMGGEGVGGFMYAMEASKKSKILIGAIVQTFALLGMLLAYLISNFVNDFMDVNPDSHIWRMPFIIGFCVAIIGIWIRSHMPETLHKPAENDNDSKAALNPFKRAMQFIAEHKILNAMIFVFIIANHIMRTHIMTYDIVMAEIFGKSQMTYGPFFMALLFPTLAFFVKIRKPENIFKNGSIAMIFSMVFFYLCWQTVICNLGLDIKMALFLNNIALCFINYNALAILIYIFPNNIRYTLSTAYHNTAVAIVQAAYIPFAITMKRFDMQMVFPKVICIVMGCYFVLYFFYKREKIPKNIALSPNLNTKNPI